MKRCRLTWRRILPIACGVGPVGLSVCADTAAERRSAYLAKGMKTMICPLCMAHCTLTTDNRYVLCSMNVKEHQLTTSLTPVSELVRLTSVDAQPLAPKRIPLEWNAHNDVSVPYEVTIDCAKLQKAGRQTK